MGKVFCLEKREGMLLVNNGFVKKEVVVIYFEGEGWGCCSTEVFTVSFGGVNIGQGGEQIEEGGVGISLLRESFQFVVVGIL